MCTVSWLPGPTGYTLCFNRDERFTRAPGGPPAIQDSGEIPFIAPRDGDFGGTWLAANACGLTLGILNRYRVADYAPPAAPRSRGLLPLALAAQPTAADAIVALAGMDLGAFQPFTLVVAEAGAPARLAAWDGRALEVSLHAEPGLILTSSSVTEPEVAESRRALFRSLVEVTVDALETLHRSHLPERGRRSVCMHREDAETQSFSEVRVTADQVSFFHVPDAPCRSARLPTIQLPRRAAPCPTTR